MNFFEATNTEINEIVEEISDADLEFVTGGDGYEDGNTGKWMHK